MLSEIQKILTGAVLLLLVLLGWGLWNQSRANAALTSAAQHAGEALAAKQEKDQAVVEAATLHQQNAALKVQLKALPRPVAPPQPGPPPATDEALGAALVGKGMAQGLRVTDAPTSSLGSLDARLVWNWYAQADRVRGFEVKSAADEAFMGKQGELIKGQAREIGKLGEVVTAGETQTRALNLQISDLTRATQSDRRVITTGKVVIAVAIPLTAYAGFRLGRH